MKSAVLLVKKTNRSRKNGQTQQKLKSARNVDVSPSDRQFWSRNYQVSRFPGIGFPDELHCTLKYVEEGISFTGLTPSAQVYQINSLFDPNLTGTGHQPMWFDQIAAVYGKYVVVGARVEAEIVNLNDSTGIAKCVAVYDDINNSSLIVEDLSESRYGRELICGSRSSSNGVKHLNLPAMPLSKLFGQDEIVSDPNLYSLTTANPNAAGWYIFKAKSIDGVNNIALLVNFTIYFDCVFKELGATSASLTSKTEKKKILTPDSRNVSSKTSDTVGVRDLPTMVQRTPSMDIPVTFKGLERFQRY